MLPTVGQGRKTGGRQKRLSLRYQGREVTVGVRPEDIPWIEEDGVTSLPWAPEAEVRILRVLGLPTRRGPALEAQACYEELGIDEPSARS